MLWNPALDAQLAALWQQTPRLTAEQIAQRMGLNSRHVVVGRARRIALPVRLNRSNHRIRMDRRIAFEAGKPVGGAGSGISFADLQSHHCRYPINDDHPFLFCGEVKKEGSSYCPFHADLCADKG